MKVIIAGCRNWVASLNAVSEAVENSAFEITQLVSGKAPGIDTSGEIWARSEGIPIKNFSADWSKFGRSAGPLRNLEMGRYADALIAFWDGKSRGTINMINVMRKLGKPYFVVPLGNVILVDTYKPLNDPQD